MTRPNRGRIYHRAAKITANGQISALCYRTPRAIPMHIANWTLRPEGVTCPKCRRIQRQLDEQVAADRGTP